MQGHSLGSFAWSTFCTKNGAGKPSPQGSRAAGHGMRLPGFTRFRPRTCLSWRRWSSLPRLPFPKPFLTILVVRPDLPRPAQAWFPLRLLPARAPARWLAQWQTAPCARRTAPANRGRQKPLPPAHCETATTNERTRKSGDKRQRHETNGRQPPQKEETETKCFNVFPPAPSTCFLRRPMSTVSLSIRPRCPFLPLFRQCSFTSPVCRSTPSFRSYWTSSERTV